LYKVLLEIILESESQIKDAQNNQKGGGCADGTPHAITLSQSQSKYNGEAFEETIQRKNDLLAGITAKEELKHREVNSSLVS
jgi:hypothetical protein